MMFTDKWAFCHIPKTGGMNFKTRLKEKGEMSFPDNKYPYTMFLHQPISYWIEIGTIPEGYQWITIVRNPYSRLVSWYYFLKQRGKIPSFEQFVKTRFLLTHKGGGHWNEFIENGGTWRMHWEQYRWIKGEQNCKVFHMENLKELEDYTGYKFMDTQHNSTRHGPWEDHYTKETRDIVYERYREAFENFGYRR